MEERVGLHAPTIDNFDGWTIERKLRFKEKYQET